MSHLAGLAKLSGHVDPPLQKLVESKTATNAKIKKRQTAIAPFSLVLIARIIGRAMIDSERSRRPLQVNRMRFRIPRIINSDPVGAK